MRDKFSELIKKGVAKFDYKPLASDIPEQDPICRQYNNIFSIATDTHMHLNKETGTRYISGSMVAKEQWKDFMCAQFWAGVNFRHSGFWSLCNFLQRNGLCGKMGILNGDVVYEVYPCNGEDCPCGMAPTVYTTSESKIPQHIAQITINGDMMKIKECYNGKNNLYEVCNALNESMYVLGNEWTVNGNNIMCPFGNKVVIL